LTSHFVNFTLARTASALKPPVPNRLSDFVLWCMVTFLCMPALVGCADPGAREKKLIIDWSSTTVINKTTPTLQVVVNPRLQPGQPLGDAAFKAVLALAPDSMRFQTWFPYPKLAVAELQAPDPHSTSWDFTLIDPLVNEFMTSTEGKSTVMSFSTIPQWMFVTDAPVTYPSDPSQEVWNYEQGTELRDLTCTELAGYYQRLASWYGSGGFTDENGQWHDSGHHYGFPVWEVLNEPDSEHRTTAEDYTRRYDAIVDAVRSVNPDTKFMGLSLAQPAAHLDFIQYFLDSSNHLPGIPIDYISYHFYAVPGPQETLAQWQYSVFQQVDQFLSTVNAIETIRKQLAPTTRTDIDELGSILPTDAPPAAGVMPPSAWWNLSGAMYAYTYVKLARLQIDIVGASQLVGFPTQYQTLSLMDWTTNQPNARFWVLKLLKDSFHSGDELVKTDLSLPIAFDVEAQAFVTSAGRRLLLVNKRNHTIDVPLPDAENASALVVDAQSAEGPARTVIPSDGRLTLQPFAVAVANWNSGK